MTSLCLKAERQGPRRPCLALGPSFLYRKEEQSSLLFPPLLYSAPGRYGLGLAVNCQALKQQGLTGAEAEPWQ